MSYSFLKNGDVIFIVDEAEKDISNLSLGFGGYSYYHCALYIGNGEIIESVKDCGVIQDNISKYSNKKKLVARVSESDCFLEKIVINAKNFIGYAYNDLFLPNTKGKLYCSELIHAVFNNVSNTKYFTQHKLNYINLGDTKISKYWLDFYSNFGLKVPQGEYGSHPNNLSLDNKFAYRFFLSKQ
ncbi:MAG: hypothetical protein Kow0076_7500 [Francisella sp.]